MFESKKFLAVLVALVLVGTVGGAIIAIKFLRPKPEMAAATPPAAQPTAAPTPAAAPAPAEPVAEKTPEPVAQPVADIPHDFEILTRKDWKAHAPVGELKPQTPKAITIHHTAVRRNTKMNFADKLRSLQAFAQHAGPQNTQGEAKPAWADITSHYYIDYKGQIAEGADVNYAADFKETYNTIGHISVCLEGNFEDEEPTSEQMDSLGKLVAWLSRKYNIPSDKIKTHQDYASTACPGKNLQSKLAVIREASLK